MAASLAILLGAPNRLVECAQRAWSLVFVGLSVPLCVVDIGFFQEYKDHFNHWIFGLIYDDRKAVLQTIWSEYPVVAILVGVALGVALLGWAFRRFLTRPWMPPERCWPWLQPWPCRGLLLALLGTILVIALRGSAGPRPVQLRDAAVMLFRGKGLVPDTLDLARLAGSHLDIVPTLVELAAPAGFAYYSLGRGRHTLGH